MEVNSVAVSHVVLPLTLVYVSICMNYSTLTVGCVVDVPSQVNASIRPCVLAFALPDIVTDLPLSFIAYSILEGDHGPGLYFFLRKLTVPFFFKIKFIQIF